MQILSAKNYSLSVLLVRVRRNPKKAQNVENAVRKILDDVRQNKDKALFSLAKKKALCPCFVGHHQVFFARHSLRSELSWDSDVPEQEALKANSFLQIVFA